jgi:hypothetical protein
MDLSLLQPISQFAAAIGVCVAAVYYVMNLRISQRNQELSLKTQELALKAQQQTLETRQAQLFVQLYSQYYNKDWVAAAYDVSTNMKYGSYEEFWEKYGSVEEVQKWDLLSHYFEGAGILVKKGLIDPSLVSDLFSEEFVSYWERISPFVMEYRVRANKPRTCENQEYLYGLIKESVGE